MNNTVHPKSDIKSVNIGEKNRIWQFVVIFPNTHIVADCNIYSHASIENDVNTGEHVMVKFGAQFLDGLRIEDDVFIGPNATFINDPFPRTKLCSPAFSVAAIKAGAFVEKKRGNGGRGCGVNKVGNRQRCGCWQSSTHHPLLRVERWV